MRSIVLSLTMDERLAIYKRVTEVIMSNIEGMPNCADVHTGHVPGRQKVCRTVRTSVQDVRTREGIIKSG